MPKQIIFSATVEGTPRLLFSIQERASGDLTIVMKHSKFATDYEGAPSDDSDTVTEEGLSVHRSLQSAENNVVKYTRVLKDGRCLYNMHFTKAIKKNGLFASVFLRRAGNLLDSRYTIDPARGNLISIGRFDPPYFQSVFMVLVGPADISFNPTSDRGINFTQVRFEHFSIVILWQFLMLDSEASSRTLIPKKFKEEEIDAADSAERQLMADMASGVTEDQAINIFNEIKHEFPQLFLSESWQRLDQSQKIAYWPMQQAMLIADVYSRQRVAFSDEHKELIFRLARFTRWFETSGAPITAYSEEQES
jgi:hypothetical protein